MAVETVTVRLDETWKLISADNAAAMKWEVVGFRDAIFAVGDAAPAAGTSEGMRDRSIPPTVWGAAKVYARAVRDAARVSVTRTVNAANASTVALQKLALSASTFAINAASGTVIGAVQNKAAGSALRVVSGGKRVAMTSDGASAVVGLDPGAPGKFAIEVLETHPDAGENTTVLELTATAPALTITGSPPAAEEGKDYAFRPVVAGGYGERSFRLVGGLPRGWSISSTTGAIYAAGGFISAAAGAVGAFSIVVSDESGQEAKLDIPSISIGGGGVTPPPSGEIIGGVAIGAAGTAGSIYDGLKLFDGDDFKTLDIIGPGKANGRYIPAKGYGAPRGNAQTLVMYDTDPLTTGYMDSNRGKAVGFDNMAILDGTRLKLQARRATAAEQAHFSPIDASVNGGKRLEMGAAIHSGLTCTFYPGANRPILLEAKIRLQPGAPAGDHFAFWTYTTLPTLDGPNGDEWDILEFNSQGAHFNYNKHVNSTIPVQGSYGPRLAHFDNVDRVYSARLQKSQEGKLFVDGTLTAQSSGQDANSQNVPSYFMFTHHVYGPTFDGDTYSPAAWASDADGSIVDIDHWRIWATPDTPHYKPKVSVPGLTLDYNGSGTIDLPSKLDLWSDASVNEVVKFVSIESHDLGRSEASAPQFPAGVSYDAATRRMTVNWSAVQGNPGRAFLVVEAYSTDGSVCRPAVSVINRGPKVALSTLTFVSGQTVDFDLYSSVLCGSLLPKTIEVSGLTGSGLVFSPTTGKITGTAAQGNFTVNVAARNNLSQAATTDIAMTVSAASSGQAYTAWTDRVGTFDGATASDVTAANGRASLWTNREAGKGDLTQAATANQPYYPTGLNANGKTGIRPQASASPNQNYMVAASGTQLADLFKQIDRDFTILMVAQFRASGPTIPFSWGEASNTGQRCEMVHRVGSAATFAYGASSVSLGTLAVNTPHVIAIRHKTGKTTAWVNAQTPLVSEVAQAPTVALTTPVLLLGTRYDSANTFFSNGADGVYYRFIVASEGHSDSDIQASLQALAAEYNLPLAA